MVHWTTSFVVTCTESASFLPWLSTILLGLTSIPATAPVRLTRMRFSAACCLCSQCICASCKLTCWHRGKYLRLSRWCSESWWSATGVTFYAWKMRSRQLCTCMCPDLYAKGVQPRTVGIGRIANMKASNGGIRWRTLHVNSSVNQWEGVFASSPCFV